jgi:uncharacterized DUF497 family protein
MDFEWDDRKASLNLERHGIDFGDAGKLFDGRRIVVAGSHRSGEMRWIATGQFGNEIWSVVYTRRRTKIRIISARKARRNEKERYYRSVFGRGN